MLRLPHIFACCVVIFQLKGGDAFQSLLHVRHKSFQSRSLSSLQAFSSNDNPYEKNSNDGILSEAIAAREGTSSRRIFFASSLVGAGSLLGYGLPEVAVAQTNIPSNNNVEFLWEKSPVNPKRSSFRVTDAEKIYNLSFVTYLSRFLLSFDSSAQQWWMDRATEIPTSISKEEIFNIREEQFARFSASVEVGLQEDDFVGKDGPKRLLQSLLGQFGAPDRDGEDSDRFTRETKEARRQLALLFGLLDSSQPTEEITKLLASIDNGTIETVILSEDARSAGLLGGFSPEDTPTVEFPQPRAGTSYSQAVGKAVLTPTGKLLRVEIIDGGEGYTEVPNIFEVFPEVLPGGEPAITDAKIVNGVLMTVKLINVGSGYNQENVVEKKLKAPRGGGKSATIRIIPEMEIIKIDVAERESGTGYAVENPVEVVLVPSAGGEPQCVGISFPVGEMGSFVAARKPGENKIRNFERTLIKDEVKVISGAASGGNLPPARFPEKASSSQQLLALLPQGWGLEYDAPKRIYILSVDEEYQKLYPAMTLQAPDRPDRPLVPDFGPRGRSPIEQNQKIDLSTFLRFTLSGAICASVVHLTLTPLDVVKTKVQINPDRYPNILPSFTSVWKEEGPSTFFTGWLPTICGHFFAGGILFGTTEVIRRYLTEAAGVNAMALEVPIILAAAVIASGTASVLYCPFDAVRIRSVAQPRFGANAIEIATRMVKEEGIEVLTDAIPVFVAKQVPYAAVKFLIFDLTTEKLYQTYPLAQEDLKLSLGISLISGVLAGIAAATVSNPADAIISELKKAKTDQTPQEALQALLDRAGVPALFKGLSIRMVLYSLTSAFQFLVYDGVRFALGVGPDDLRLYLDVLGESLNTNT